MVELKSCNILAGSGEGRFNETLSNGQFEGPEPEQDGDGFIWADLASAHLKINNSHPRAANCMQVRTKGIALVGIAGARL